MFDYIGVVAIMKDLCRQLKKEDIFAEIYCRYCIFTFIATIIGIGLLLFSSISKWIIIAILIVLTLISVILGNVHRFKRKTKLEKVFNTNFKLGCLTSDYLRHIIENYEGGKYKDKVWCEAYPCLNIVVPIRVQILIRYLPCNEAEVLEIKEMLEAEAKKLQNAFSEVAKSKVEVRFLPYK